MRRKHRKTCLLIRLVSHCIHNHRFKKSKSDEKYQNTYSYTTNTYYIEFDDSIKT